MLSKLHDRLGTAGLVVAIIALVVALTGTAIAAGGLTKPQEKRVIKIAKKFAGKNGKRGKRGRKGATGPQGAPGVAGAPGKQGAPGANGKDGINGAPGANGKDGTSVSVTAIPTEVEGCEGRGGAEVKQMGAASGVEVCAGEEGSPWAAGGVLPPEKTETGTWGVGLQPGESIDVPISFMLPLAAAPTPVFVEGESGTGCPGLVNETPTAEPGKLCLYQHVIGSGEATILFLKPFSAGPAIEIGAGPSGTVLSFACKSTEAVPGNGPCARVGTWAVTAAAQ